MLITRCSCPWKKQIKLITWLKKTRGTNKISTVTQNEEYIDGTTQSLQNLSIWDIKKSRQKWRSKIVLFAKGCSHPWFGLDHLRSSFGICYYIDDWLIMIPIIGILPQEFKCGQKDSYVLTSKLKVWVLSLSICLFVTDSLVDQLDDMIPSLKLTARTWKWMVGRLSRFLLGWRNLAGAILMLVSGSVVDTDFEITPTPQPKDYSTQPDGLFDCGLAHDLRAILRRCWRGFFSWYHGPTLAVINLANARGLEMKWVKIYKSCLKGASDQFVDGFKINHAGKWLPWDVRWTQI